MMFLVELLDIRMQQYDFSHKNLGIMCLEECHDFFSILQAHDNKPPKKVYVRKIRDESRPLIRVFSFVGLVNIAVELAAKAVQSRVAVCMRHFECNKCSCLRFHGLLENMPTNLLIIIVSKVYMLLAASIYKFDMHRT